MSHPRESAPIEIPEDIFERVRTLCLVLPEVTVRVDGSRIRQRSTAYSFDIRRRSFCLLMATVGSTSRAVPLLVLRARPGERDALLSVGDPYFAREPAVIASVCCSLTTPTGRRFVSS
jgi:hypothetical protein